MSARIYGIARRTIGLTLIIITVLLWTVSNFLASTIFADNTYSKPYFITYFNTAWFSLLLLFKFVGGPSKQFFRQYFRPGKFSTGEQVSSDETQAFISGEDNASPVLQDGSTPTATQPGAPPLTVRETFRLSLEFCGLWFLANFFQSKSLEYTSVASATILMSTSGIWTLIFGVTMRVEFFSAKKLLGVLASLVGIAMVSSVDWSGGSDKHRGSFPYKTPAEIAVGDALALASAVFYGIYSVLIKRRIGDEGRVDMLLFLGFVGSLNLIFLWPGFPLLHWIGVESFALPTGTTVWRIIVINAIVSLVSDVCWAWAVLFSTPLVVTVGLSLSIPISMIGQIVINGQTSTVLYWLGALIVFVAFIVVNSEAQERDPESVTRRED